ncbi:siderophore-interacting protein [Kitasatospora sp. NPDC001527]|uniref:siderophore-interacting protein n=1 Tax=Kitasatospora sp. NPDC001527 TaxID=3154519 RepID=UPI0033283A54
MFRRPRPTHDVRVIAVTPLTPALVRLTFAGPTLDALAIEHPTQWVKLDLPEGHSRAYTIRFHRPAEREVDIDVVLHGNGPLSRWAEVARVGDPARLAGPRGRRPSFEGAGHVLLAADESALPAALTILDDLPPAVPVSLFVEVGDATGAALPLPERAGLTGHWLPRRPELPKGRTLADTLLATDLPTGTTAWLAGEANAVATVRRHLLTDWALPRERVHSKGYWKQGEADHKA